MLQANVTFYMIMLLGARLLRSLMCTRHMFYYNVLFALTIVISTSIILNSDIIFHSHISFPVVCNIIYTHNATYQLITTLNSATITVFIHTARIKILIFSLYQKQNFSHYFYRPGALVVYVIFSSSNSTFSCVILVDHLSDYRNILFINFNLYFVSAVSLCCTLISALQSYKLIINLMTSFRNYSFINYCF